MEFTILAGNIRLFDVRPQLHTFGLADARILAIGQPERSTLVHRLELRGSGQMPPLGTNVVDRDAVKWLRDWVGAY